MCGGCGAYWGGGGGIWGGGMVVVAAVPLTAATATAARLWLSSWIWTVMRLGRLTAGFCWFW